MKPIIPILLLSAACLTLGAEDPFVRTSAAPPAPSQTEPVLSVTYEAFSVSLDQAAALQRVNPGDTEFYNQLTALVANGGAKQEHLMIARGKPGQRATAESITELIYPTEYEPGELPAYSPGSGSILPAAPTAFETRNSGFNLDMEPVLSADRSVVDLRLVPDHVSFVGREKWGKGNSETEMPIFDTQRITAAVSAIPGSPCLIGTISRVEIPRPQESSARRVWFAFVTVDIVKN